MLYLLLCLLIKVSAIILYPPRGRTQQRGSSDGQKLLGRNESIAEYLEYRVGELFGRILEARPVKEPKKRKPRKVISSHIQVLKSKFEAKDDDENGEQQVYVPDEFMIGTFYIEHTCRIRSLFLISLQLPNASAAIPRRERETADQPSSGYSHVHEDPGAYLS